MSFASRHAKGAVFNCNTEGFKYYKPSELYAELGPDQEYVLQGLYINRRSEYGDAPVAITTEYFVNLPAYMLDEVQQMIRDQEDVDDIKSGKVGFKIEEYEKEIGKKTKTCYGIRWIDIA